MKTRLIPIAAAGLLALCWAAAGAQQTRPSAPNLIVNPSLDGPLERSNGLPKGWYTFGKPADSFQVKVVDSGRTDGKAMRIQGDGEYAGVVTNPVPIEAGKDYLVRGWVKIDSPNGNASLKIDFFDDKRSYIASSKDNPTVKGSLGNWQLISFVARCSEFPAATTLGLACVVGRNSAAIFDDVEFSPRDPGASDNMLKDGSMESVAGEGLARWKVVQAEKGDVKIVRRTVPVKDGAFSMQLMGKAQWAVIESEMFPVQPGKKYTLTGWARARKGKGNLRIAYVGEGGHLGQTTSVNVESNQWTQLTVTSELEKFPGATRINPGATIAGGGEVDLFFDSFVLKAE